MSRPGLGGWVGRGRIAIDWVRKNPWKFRILKRFFKIPLEIR
jgi:hypothetical protein